MSQQKGFPATAAPMTAMPFKYSSRVVLKTILESDEDHGLRLVGQRVVIGGWVKSSREVRKEPVAEPPPPPPPPVDDGASQTEKRDVTCSEILQSRIPFVRSIMKILGGGSNYSARANLEPAAAKPPLHSIAFLQVSDGSCASSLLVIVLIALYVC